MTEAPELTLSQINGRFRLTNGPTALPGKCVVCGGVKGQFIDIGLDVEFYGAVIFCVPCIIAAAEIIDLVPGVKYRDMEQKYLEAVRGLNVVEEVINEHTTKFNLLHRDLITGLRSAYDSPISADSEDASAESVGDSGLFSSPESEPVGITKQVSDSSLDERPDDVPSGNGNDSGGGIFNF